MSLKPINIESFSGSPLLSVAEARKWGMDLDYAVDASFTWLTTSGSCSEIESTVGDIPVRPESDRLGLALDAQLSLQALKNIRNTV